MKHKLTKLTLAAVILAALCCGSVPTLAQVVGQPADKPFATDPAVKSKLDALPARTGLMLGKFKVEADEATVKRFPSLGRNPGRRDYGNKMAYAADRGTAFYCGANHGVPHRISDVWEFNLLANTWRLVLPPGSNVGDRPPLWYITRAEERIAKGEDIEKNKALIKQYGEQITNWWVTSMVMREGYMQDPINHGPVEPWHTWDGLIYDSTRQRLYWAVLDSDIFKQDYQKMHRSIVKKHAEHSGKDFETLYAQVKPASAMYWYSPVSNRWFRQIGEPPFPRMRMMGGSLVYLPDQDRVIWYACDRAEGMWAYDGTANRWECLLDGEENFKLVQQKLAPYGEIQAAYSVKHKKMVVVERDMTFQFDFATKQWKRGADIPSWAHDNRGVFAYDSHADAWLLYSAKMKEKDDKTDPPWTICAYDITTDTWEVVDVLGDAVPQKVAPAGFYDERSNAFVIYCGRNAETYVYRHKK